ncbi:MAG: hypothetical protein KDB07_00345, partial [Planctomycetes bacterium]|nr:hypothetical protein [Planctomycetota bacterium]
MEIDISRIRELLTLMPSDSLFRQIYAILLKGTDADPMYDIAMEYILEHIESWPVGFRQTTLPTGLPVFDTFIAPRGTTELPPYAPHWKGLVTYTSDMATLRSKGWEQIRYLEVICDVPDAVVGLEMCENLEYLRISPLAGTIQGYPTLRPPDNVKVFDTIRHNFELPIKHIPLSTQHLIVRGAAATTEDV